MRAIRVGLTLAVISILGMVGSVRAADPTIGGELAAVNDTVTVTSHGSVPARIVMSAESVILSELAFDLAPGEVHRLTFTGPAEGYVYATFAAEQVAGADTSGVTLAVNLRPLAPTGPPWETIGLWTLVLAVLILTARRLRPWRWRIVRTG